MRDLSVSKSRSKLTLTEESGRSFSFPAIHAYHLVLVVIVAVGLALRLWNLGEAPLWVDESFTVWAAEHFLHGRGFSDPVGPSSPYWRGWLTTTLPIAASFAVFGPTEFAARLPSALAGTLAIAAAYLLGSQYDRQVGLLVAALVALDPFTLVWAREARMYVHLQLVYVLAVYLLLRWRYEAGLSLRSRYPVALALVTGLGVATHLSFLAFGGVFLGYMAIVLVRQWFGAGPGLGSNHAPTGVAYNAVALLAVGTAVAGGYVAVAGVPSILTAHAPAQWPNRGALYYFEFFTETYPVLWIPAAAGLTYLLFGDDRDTLVALAFLIPFLTASATPTKAPRYVYFLLPLFFILAVVPTVRLGHYLIGGVTRRLGSNRRTVPRGITLVVLLGLVVVVTPPASAIAVTQQVNDPMYHPARSDFDDASAFVEAHREESAVIMSTRPELSMWYLGETDYFFRQNGLKNVRDEGNRLVHTRTGTVVVNDRAALERVMGNERPIWFVAGKKFGQGFTSPAMRRYVREHFIRVQRPSWDNVEVYYWSPHHHHRSFDEPDSLATTTGNVFVADIDGREYLALGRTIGTEERYGTQGEALHGEAIMRFSVSPGQPVVLQTRIYGADQGNRFVVVSVSTDGTDWRVVARNDDDGWATKQVVIPEDDVGPDPLYVRFEGGSRAQNRWGGLVDSVHVHPLQEWHQAGLATDGNTTDDQIPASPNGQ